MEIGNILKRQQPTKRAENSRINGSLTQRENPTSGGASLAGIIIKICNERHITLQIL